jgi:exo-1,4-beta-D-glucosaminidase
MMKKYFYSFLFFASFFFLSCTSESNFPEEIVLKHKWAIQSSKKVHVNGDKISSQNFSPEGWYLTSMPSTVLAAQVENNEFPDPYYGTNIESIPGYEKGRMDSIPKDSPYNTSWWYRTEFDVPDNYNGKNICLKIPSINYKANVWLNGQLVADTSVIEGAYRLFNLDITKYAISGDTNCMALEIFPPQADDLTITWVDWNPTPPDRATGICTIFLSVQQDR